MNDALYHMLTIPDAHEPEGKRLLAYTEWGNPNNKDVLFCVHGLSRNARDFDYLAHALSDDYRVICIDIAGRGNSQWLSDKNRYTYDTYVQDCVTLLQELDIARVDWLGTSMGGLIGMLIAHQYPQLIRRLILNDIGPHIPSASLRRIIKYVQNTRKYETLDGIHAMLRIKLSTFGIKEDEHWGHMLKHSVMQADEGHYLFNYDPAIIKKPLPGQEIPDIELFEIWHDVPHPTLVLRGKDSDVLKPETAQAMLVTGPEPQLIEIEGVGHAPALMDEYQIGLVRNWLRDIF